MCTENGDQVPFGEDGFYEQIIVDDYRGYNFTQQQGTWREGTDLTFVAEFFAKKGEDDNSDGFASSDAIDAEMVNE